jgi:hypothetical protein
MEGAPTHHRRIALGGISLFAMTLVLSLLASSFVHAATTISQSYTSKTDLPVGSIVSLETNTTDKITPASTDNVDNIFGVVISSTGSLLTVTTEGSSQVQVATSGTLPVLASDFNGEIKRGDHITASPFTGVGMKATNNTRIIGVAQGVMTGIKKETYKTKAGEERTGKNYRSSRFTKYCQWLSWKEG